MELEEEKEEKKEEEEEEAGYEDYGGKERKEEDTGYGRREAGLELGGSSDGDGGGGGVVPSLMTACDGLLPSPSTTIAHSRIVKGGWEKMDNSTGERRLWPTSNRTGQE